MPENLKIMALLLAVAAISAVGSLTIFYHSDILTEAQSKLVDILLMSSSLGAFGFVFLFIKNFRMLTQNTPRDDAQKSKNFANIIVSVLGLVFRQKDVDEWAGDLLEGYENELKEHNLWYCRIWLVKEAVWLIWPVMKPLIKKAFPWIFGGGAVWALIKSFNPFSKDDNNG